MDAGRQFVGLAAATTVVGVGAVIGAAQTDDTGPILAFVGAILVALITAYTTDRRQRQQLAHDRSLHDLDGLRALLVRTSKTMSAEIPAFVELINAVVGKSGTLDPAADAKRLAAVNNLLDGDAALNDLRGELLLFFEDSSEIYSSFNDFSEALRAATSSGIGARSAEALERVLRDVYVELGRSSGAFRSASRRAVGYELPD